MAGVRSVALPGTRLDDVGSGDLDSRYRRRNLFLLPDDTIEGVVLFIDGTFL
jgi:hypothetical protein